MTTTQPMTLDDVRYLAALWKFQIGPDGNVSIDSETASLIHAAIESHIAAQAVVEKDAERYRWLRTHCRFANDSLCELWFSDCIIPDDEPELLDNSIDAAIAKTGGEE